MKLKENFILKKIADNYVVFPVGESTVDFHGMLALNETGALLWENLEKGMDRQQLCDELCNEYDVSPEIAATDIDDFIKKLANAGCIEL